MAWSVICTKCGKRHNWSGNCHPVPPCPHCKKAVSHAVRSSDVEAALGIVDEIEQFVEDLPGEGEDFGTSVLEKAKDIAENIERHNRVTDRQMDALENMLDGLQRWFHD